MLLATSMKSSLKSLVPTFMVFTFIFIAFAPWKYVLLCIVDIIFLGGMMYVVCCNLFSRFRAVYISESES
jgi:hypothetical protein